MRSRSAGSSSPASPPNSPSFNPRSRGFEAGKLLGEHPLEHRRIGRRAGDGGDADLADGADQKLGVADAERNDRRAGALQRQVVGHAAHPHLVVEAVHHRVTRPQPGRATGSARRRFRSARSRARTARGSSPARWCPRCGAAADRLVLAGGQIVAERRMVRPARCAAATCRTAADAGKSRRSCGGGLACPKRAIEIRVLRHVGRLCRPAFLLMSRQHVRRRHCRIVQQRHACPPLAFNKLC